MLLGESLCDPDNSHSLQAGGICQELTEMRVIGPRQLVLNKHPMVCCRILAENIGSEGADTLVLGFELKFQSEGFAERGQIPGMGEPRREVARLRSPNAPKRHLTQFTKTSHLNTQIDGTEFMKQAACEREIAPGPQLRTPDQEEGGPDLCDKRPQLTRDLNRCVYPSA